MPPLAAAAGHRRAGRRRARGPAAAPTGWRRSVRRASSLASPRCAEVRSRRRPGRGPRPARRRRRPTAAAQPARPRPRMASAPVGLAARSAAAATSAASPAPGSPSAASITIRSRALRTRCRRPRRDLLHDAGERGRHVHRRLVGLERDQRVLDGHLSPTETRISMTGTSSKSPMSGTATCSSSGAHRLTTRRGRRGVGVDLVLLDRLGDHRRVDRAVVGELLQRRDRT